MPDKVFVGESEDRAKDVAKFVAKEELKGFRVSETTLYKEVPDPENESENVFQDCATHVLSERVLTRFFKGKNAVTEATKWSKEITTATVEPQYNSKGAVVGAIVQWT